MPNDANPLQTEIATFDRMRAELERTYDGKFVLVKGTDFVGAWDTFEAAGQEALRRFGLGPYLIRQVERVLPPSSS